MWKRRERTDKSRVAVKTEIKKRFCFVAAAMLFVVVMGSVGYYLIFRGQSSFLDCIYMTIISLTTVGYGEILPVSGQVHAKIFTIFLIIFGMGVILYGISTLTALFVEGHVSGIFRRRRMEKRISKLRGHYIVCGGGQTGWYVVEELIKDGEQAVLIEQDEEQLERFRSSGHVLHIQGDATEDDNLIAAGIQNAKGIIISLPSDKDALYVTMTARMLNPSIRIISGMVNPKIEQKLRKAGADGVVASNFIGGLRMASEMIRPTAVHFLDRMLRSKKGTIRIHEITVSPRSQFNGKTIKALALRDRFNVLVLALKEPDTTEMTFIPPVDTPVVEGMTLVVMGEMEKIARMQTTE